MKFFQKIKKYNYLINISILLNIILFIFLLFYIYLYINKGYQPINFSRESNTSYKFISPILDCEDNNADTSSSLIYSKMNDFIGNLVKKYNIQTTSVYYRDLNNGPWYGYNEKEYFYPASLMKLPVMIALFKYSEADHSILNKKFLIKQSDIDNVLFQNIKPSKHLEAGKEYTMLELVNYMIKESDNAAFNIIKANFPSDKYINEVFKQVGVDIQTDNNEVVLRTKDYAGFFRVLYNASYLNKDNSELSLKILSESDFKDGLVSGVPDDVVVAHKFGERSIDGNGLISQSQLPDGTKQLHDCGIVYSSKNDPYILCVMTRGSDFKNQESFVGDVSHYVYDNMTKK